MARNNISDDKVPAVDKALRDMFRTLQNRPTPGRLLSVVDQLDEGSSEGRLKKSG